MVDTLGRWQASGRQSVREMDWIIRHASRTLVKAGHRPTLELLGVEAGRQVTVTDLTVSPTVELGGHLDVPVTLRTDLQADVIVDYALRSAGPGERPGGRKVYKLRRMTIASGASATLTKGRPMRARMTTRTIHAGDHLVEILVNGVPLASRHFRVVPPPPPDHAR